MSYKGYKHTVKTKEKMRLSHLGKKISKKAKEKIRLKAFNRRWTDEMKRYFSEIAKGRTSAFKGRKHTEEAKKKNGDKKRGRYKGENNPNWKGGITDVNKLLRKSEEAKIWRESIFSRDDWTCQNCGQQGGDLEIHHIYSWKNYPKLRFDINNGITFCKKCHSIYDPNRRI